MAGDQHRLPIVVLSATLAQRGVACRSLGTDLPAHALVTAIRRTACAGSCGVEGVGFAVGGEDLA
jgi:MerR family transcriptional regulator, light-induced transcriptional regulator